MSTTSETDASNESRKAALERFIAIETKQGYRVESQTDYQAVLVKGKNHSHGLHLFLTIITVGLWGLFVWLPLTIFGGEKRAVISVDINGKANIQR